MNDGRIYGRSQTIDPDLGVSRGVGETSQKTNTENGSGFLQVLEKSIDEVNQNQIEADRSIKEMVAGKSKNIHETL